MRSRPVASSSPSVLIASARSLPSDGRRPQALHRVPPFGDRFRSVFNRTIQFLFRVCRALRQQVRRRLEPQQQTVEALQQRVVQFAGDSGPLPNARVERHVELVMQLADTQLVTRPQQRHKNSRARTAKPRRAPPWGENLQAQSHSVFIPHPAIIRALNAQRVVPGGQCREGRYPALGVHRVPGTVERLEHVPILVPLRVHVAQSRELEGEQVLVVRQRQGRRRRDGLCEDGPGPGATGTFRNENCVRTTGGMYGVSTIWSGQNDVSPLLLPKNI